MIDFGTPFWWRTVIPALSMLALLLALVIVLKAVRGYRQNRDRRMLLLAAGLFLLLLAPIPVELAAVFLFEESVEGEIAVSVLQQVLRVAGMATILASMYVRR